jgi:hypothetical protein
MPKRFAIALAALVGVGACGWLLLTARPSPAQPAPPLAGESATALAREWRYPGGDYVSAGPDGSDTLRLEWATVDADFEDVGTYYAKWCGREKNDGPVFRPMAPDKKAGPGYTMAAGGHIASEYDFAQNTARGTVHVTVQRREGKRVLVRTVVGVR